MFLITRSTRRVICAATSSILRTRPSRPLLPLTKTFTFSHSIHTTRPLSIIHKFTLADIGEGITECELVQWYTKEGSKIAQFDKICEVQSDKATVEITSRYDGVVKKLLYKAGDVVKVGSVLVEIEDGGSSEVGGGEEVEIVKETEKEEVVRKKETPPVTTTATANTMILATPAVRRLARELNIDLNTIKGSGRDGRITKEDLLNTSSTSSTNQTLTPTLATSNTTAPTPIPLTLIQKQMSKQMAKSLAIPHFGYCDDYYFDNLISTKSKLNTKLMPLFIKLFSIVLTKYPLLNASYTEGDSITLNTAHNVGIAVDSKQGLVVPNIKSVERKSLAQIETEFNALVERARDGKLLPNDFNQTTITISNIGSIGGTVMKPVIPSGTVCIVAMGKSQFKPIYNDDGELEKRLVCTLSYSADHRVIDGATVARFSNDLRGVIEDCSNILRYM